MVVALIESMVRRTPGIRWSPHTWIRRIVVTARRPAIDVYKVRQPLLPRVARLAPGRPR